MSTPPADAIEKLRHWSIIEGWSFVVLLTVAMPLKYLAGQPLAVKVFGWAHGVLFVTVCLLLLRAQWLARWSLVRGALVFAGALVPLGPFLLDRPLRRWAAEAASRVSTRRGADGPAAPSR